RQQREVVRGNVPPGHHAADGNLVHRNRRSRGARHGGGQSPARQRSRPHGHGHRSSGAAGGVGVMRLHVGGAMWTHKAWQGRFLAHPAPTHERLRSYAGWCNAVEGNTTFYATPARDTVASWARQTDPDFRFVIKLPKPITHERRLTDVDEELRAFLA